ncbi:MAG TPA: helix-turn-helix domain-containing protein [Aquabacterium sp.]|nr:helix-turn-helix domain-containing protein [Aquabacterium sp.]
MNKRAVFYWAASRGIYVGRVEREYKRSYTQSTMLVSMGDELELLLPTSQQRVVSKSLLVPAGADVVIATHGNPVTLCFLDNHNQDASVLVHRMQQTTCDDRTVIHHNLDGVQDVIAFGDHLQQERPTARDAEAIADEWLFAHIRKHRVADTRVEEAIRLIRASLSENTSVDEIANQVGLSASRLAEVFKAVTGVPIRRFRLWQRVLATAAQLKHATSLTDAAMAAGFADYAQFSRTYRLLAGGNPSDAQKHTEIHAELFLG